MNKTTMITKFTGFYTSYN